MLDRLPRYAHLPDPIPADHSDLRVKLRESLSIGKEVYQTWLEVWLTGDTGCTEAVKVEVDYVLTAKGHEATWDDPGAPDEFEIVAVRPYEHRKLETGFKGTERTYLPCPNWLSELLIGCVDADSLKAEHC